MSSDEQIHVFDLPQIHSRPCLQHLLDTLEKFRIQPSSFDGSAARAHTPSRIDPEGVPRYLTSIISSSLSWLEDDASRERVWDTAGARLAERSGRNAAPDMTRSFEISPLLTVELYEPSLTEDNLGLKTWTSSFLLAKRLPLLRKHVSKSCSRVLELGAGTGLVGIAAAFTWNVDVVLTDLPAIVPNLQKNVEQNIRSDVGGSHDLVVRALDWSDDTDMPEKPVDAFKVILSADPIYSAEHPRMLADTVQKWLAKDDEACFIVELPLRGGYSHEREDLNIQLRRQGLCLVEDGTEVGYDDWQGDDNNPAEVVCWWSVWKWSSTTSGVE